MEQLIMIDKLRDMAGADERISAVMMYGSFAQGHGDRYSDIEFYIFLREGCQVDKREWISRIRPIEMLFTNEFGTDVAVFDNLVRGEFHFHSVSEIGIIAGWQGMIDFSVHKQMNLVDKEGLLTAEFDGIEQVRPLWNTPENIRYVAESMINNLLFAGNVIRRGEFARASWLWYFLEKYLAQLIRLHVGSTEQWLGPLKNFEKEIPDKWHKRYAECIPHLNGGNLASCYAKTVALTKELFKLLDTPPNVRSILDRIADQSGILANEKDTEGIKHLFSESASWDTISEFVSPDGIISQAKGESVVSVRGQEVVNESWAQLGNVRRTNSYKIAQTSPSMLISESLNPELGKQTGVFHIDRNTLFSKFKIEGTTLNGYEIIRREGNCCYAQGALHDNDTLVNSWTATMNKRIL